VKPVLVTGATGHIGREVVTTVRGEGRPVRAMTRNPQSAKLPDDVDVVRGDLAVPDTLDAALKGVDAVFLVWVSPLALAAAAVDRIAKHASRIVLLTAPHRTSHPFFQQPNPMKTVQIGVERLIETSGLQWTFVRPHMFAGNCRYWWVRRSGAATSSAGFMETSPRRRLTSATSPRSPCARCATMDITVRNM
jgi:uncharacterized protein YbjT (DUF2867 family)